jgi:glycosidase
MGEVIHGDYNKWLNGSELVSVTNYECWKGLHSSLNDHNYFEIAYALKRQFGPNGLYKGKLLYNFCENHDVSRAASLLKKQAHLYPLYLLLFTMPGIPSIYYGGEFGLGGLRTETNDRPLRPALSLDSARSAAPHPDLAAAIRKFAELRASSVALRLGDYHELSVSHKVLAFAREANGERVIVALNSSDEWLEIPLEQRDENAQYEDRLNGETIHLPAAKPKLKVPPNWGRVLYRK